MSSESNPASKIRMNSYGVRRTLELPQALWSKERKVVRVQKKILQLQLQFNQLQIHQLQLQIHQLQLHQLQLQIHQLQLQMLPLPAPHQRQRRQKRLLSSVSVTNTNNSDEKSARALQSAYNALGTVQSQLINAYNENKAVADDENKMMELHLHYARDSKGLSDMPRYWETYLRTRREFSDFNHLPRNDKEFLKSRLFTALSRVSSHRAG